MNNTGGIALCLFVVLLTAVAVGTLSHAIGFGLALLLALASVVISFAVRVISEVVVQSRRRAERSRQLLAEANEKTRRYAERQDAEPWEMSVRDMRKSRRTGEPPKPIELKRPIQCPSCGSTNISYDGNFREHTEWHCEDCRHYFSTPN